MKKFAVYAIGQGPWPQQYLGDVRTTDRLAALMAAQEWPGYTLRVVERGTNEHAVMERQLAPAKQLVAGAA